MYYKQVFIQLYKICHLCAIIVYACKINLNCIIYIYIDTIIAFLYQIIVYDCVNNIFLIFILLNHYLIYKFYYGNKLILLIFILRFD